MLCEVMCEATVDRDLLGRTHVDSSVYVVVVVGRGYLLVPACLPACLSATGRHIYHLLVCLERRPGRPCSPTSICKQQALSGSPYCHNEREECSRCLMYPTDAHRCCSRKAFLLASICLIMSCFFFPMCSARCCHQKYTIGGVASKRPMAVK